MWIVFFVLIILPLPLSVQAEYLGELSENPYAPDSTANPFGAGSPFKPDGINNPFSQYGSPFSNQSATNPFATFAYLRLHVNWARGFVRWPHLSA